VWQVLPSVGDKNPPNFAFVGSSTLSEYFSSSFNNCDPLVTLNLIPSYCL